MQGYSPKIEVGLDAIKVGGCQTSAGSQMYMKRTYWIIPYKEVCPCLTTWYHP